MIITSIRRGDCPAREAGFGWVYVLVAGTGQNACKIGIAVDLAARLKRTADRYNDRDYSIRLHCAFRVPWSVNRSPTQIIEGRSHSRLYGLRAPGSEDWFFVPPDHAEAVVRAECLRLLGKEFHLIRFPEVTA